MIERKSDIKKKKNVLKKPKFDRFSVSGWLFFLMFIVWALTIFIRESAAMRADWVVRFWIVTWLAPINLLATSLYVRHAVKSNWEFIRSMRPSAILLTGAFALFVGLFGVFSLVASVNAYKDIKGGTETYSGSCTVRKQVNRSSRSNSRDYYLYIVKGGEEVRLEINSVAYGFMGGQPSSSSASFPCVGSYIIEYLPHSKIAVEVGRRVDFITD